MLNFIVFLVGLALLAFGANQLVDGAAALAKRLEVPNIVIGLTIVAFGTSAPELSVNLVAAIQHDTDIALGNIVGSNILNIFLILGISAILYPLAVKSNTTWIEIPLALLSGLVILATTNDRLLDAAPASTISRADGIIYLFFFIIFLVYNFQLARSTKESDPLEVKSYSTFKSLLFILLGLTLLVIGGRLMVEGAVNIARLLGISERLIALTIVSIGTSLPELATSVIAARKKNTDIAIGNVVGSNIFNVFFILGLTALISPLPIQPEAQFDILVNILASILLFVFLFVGKGRRIVRWEGVLFLALYGLYLCALAGGWF
ncbi:MAG: calcium/sodium antiporter [Lewinellaceae bacterium]|nr:calcium/sodium antiporter [Lewinellaceae bacterium]